MSDYGHCDHKNCDNADVLPQYTRALTAPRLEHQPRWYCATHRSKHPNVSPTTGERLHKQYPSYLKKDGEYVGLMRVKRGGVNAA